jgi:hypothetical protein
MQKALWFVTAAISVLALPNSAVAATTFSNSWSFFDILSGTYVEGTISGIENGTHVPASGLTALVSQAPFAVPSNLFAEGSGFQYYDANNGVITFANISLREPSNFRLFLGTDPAGATYQPALYRDTRTEYAYNPAGGLTFLAIGGAVPEPTTWAMMIGGLGAVGGAVRRRRSSVKTTVSFA